MKRLATIILPVLGLCLGLSISFYPERSDAQRAGMGFETYDVMFESGDLRPTVPFDWTFRGLGNGKDKSSTSLWFSDKQGNMHILSGSFRTGPNGGSRFVMDRNHFIMRKR